MVSVPLALRLVGLRGRTGTLGEGCLLMMILGGWIRLIRVVMLRFFTGVRLVLVFFFFGIYFFFGREKTT